MNNEKFISSGLKEWMLSIEEEDRKIEMLEKINSDNFTDFYNRELGTYDYQKGLGLCGILLPTGYFIKCHDQQHSLISSLLNEREKFLSIYFSSRLIFGNEDSVVSLHFENNGSAFDSSFTRERMLYNLRIQEGVVDNLDCKILITQSQIDFISKHYNFMNTSQKEMLNIKFLDRWMISSIFTKELIANKVYVLSI